MPSGSRRTRGDVRFCRCRRGTWVPSLIHPCQQALLNDTRQCEGGGWVPVDPNACIVRVEAKVHEFATEMTESVITALKTDGRPWTPASLIARTKGEAAVLLFEAPRRSFESDGTMRPTMKRDRQYKPAMRQKTGSC